jgi:beta-N-acetylhexosaminidase
LRSIRKVVRCSVSAKGFTRLPALARIGEVYDRDPVEAVRLAEEHAWVMASELRASGVDFSFAPVVDLARGNAAIGSRAFHADPVITAELAGLRARHAFGRHGCRAEALSGARLRRCRYAQGTGDRSAFSWTISAATICALHRSIEARIEAVMMAHVVYPAVDDQPAGYSRRWIEDILRGELGFQGAVISDDISMAAAGALAA